jgi:glucose-1-phosphate thymidylyltransferase
MRAVDPDAPLTPEQQAAADAGLKPLMPVNGRPFLDYVLSALADACIADVALVVAPDHDALRRRYAIDAPPSRVSLTFVVQREPLGTADAVLAAREWSDGKPFLTLNADNVYPVSALADLSALDEPGLCVFERDALVSSGNFPADRVRAFALVQVDDSGYLTSIVEKPAAGEAVGLPPEGGSYKSSTPVGSAFPRTPVASAFRRKDEVLVSMNCWHFDSRIFAACRDVPRSSRGEFELPQAVGLAIARGVRFRALRAHGAVLDLSRRADAADLARRLAGVSPRP